MASRGLRTLKSTTIRCKTHFFTQYLSLSTSSIKHPTPPRPSNPTIPSSQETPSHSNPDESRILEQLSEILPISQKTPIHRYRGEGAPEVRDQARVADAFLPPEDKLRGVFLQKLRGKSAVEKALDNFDKDLSFETFGKVVDRGNLSGEAMISFFKWAIKKPQIGKGIGSYKVILKALGRRNYVKYVAGVLHDMKVEGVIPDSETLSIVVNSFVRARHVTKAVKMFGELEEFGWVGNAENLNVILECLSKRSHVGLASSMFNKLNGKMQFNSMTYNILIGGWARFGKVDEMEKVMEAMSRDGFSPDCLTYSYVIEGFGKAGRVDDSVKVFDDLVNRGWVPDTCVYNAIIGNLISNGDFGGCVKYYEQMGTCNCEPNLDTYTKLISGFLRVRKVADALEMFDVSLSKGMVPTTGTVTSYIKPLCSYGPPHAAMMIYKKARKAGCKISLTAYKLLLMRLSRFGKCGTILILWDEMQECGHDFDLEVYEYVINGLCNIGQLENAIIVMEESLRNGFCPGRLICSKLNHKLINADKVERAYRLFLKIKEARLAENARKYWRSKGWHF
uniref:Pentatricopeptide repeat-containing protein n=1 Tax=Kalanchoe fedtschenkoi TaxID=63787 RepID=A0A7N0ZQY2_KALFE